MRKKKARTSKRKKRRLHYGSNEWQRVTRVFENEIIPIVKTLKSNNNRLTVRARRSLGNYLVIRLVSMTEYYFSNIVRRLVDERNLDASKIMTKKSLKEQLSKGQDTAGELVAMTPNYANYVEIDGVLSKLLDLKFLSTVRELDRTDPYKKYAEGAVPLNNNWKEFKEMFDLRDDIVHEMKDAVLCSTKLLSLADNTMNFLDAASWICHPEFSNYESNRIIR